MHGNATPNLIAAGTGQDIAQSRWTKFSSAAFLRIIGGPLFYASLFVHRSRLRWKYSILRLSVAETYSWLSTLLPLTAVLLYSGAASVSTHILRRRLAISLAYHMSSDLVGSETFDTLFR
ncbi:hypothetical protein SISSUDRAFT_1043532 [Sistotremastrum suecicum HHB10207 ss-3]|uniref:Uncharacterized protein n=1 Tax=Sistotremastrum suecicum HHB10207 ss-3 TaxID=1314776 RepID=A0A166FTV4_9AGAM|nr:hypothetical protein SISSUDRAFT_1043532 [Sistotremastrum suecicum HHB10207 ss-3]